MPIFIFIAAAVFVVSTAPPFHNNDANSYFGMALRLSRGDFLGAVDLLHGPLLSWCMTPFVICGVPVPYAARIVSLLAYAVLLVLTSKLARRAELGRWSHLVVALVGLQLLYFTAAIFSADLLLAPLFVAAFLYWTRPDSAANALRAGVWGGVCYLAKPVALPIFLLFIALHTTYEVLTRAREPLAGLKRFLLAAFASILVALPWIFVLSIRAEQTIISGQQLLYHGVLRSNFYSPDVAMSEYASLAPAPATPAKNLFLAQGEGMSEKISHSLASLVSLFSELFFGKEAWWIFLICLAASVVLLLPRLRPTAECSASYCGVLAFLLVYLPIWGPYPRYYFPVLPLAFVLWAGVLARLIRLSRAPLPRLLPLGLAAIVTTSVAITMIRGIRLEYQWQSADEVRAILEIPGFREGKGMLTGNPREPLAGFAAYLTGREYWNSLEFPAIPNADFLEVLLRLWRVENILWIGPEPEMFMQTEGLRRESQAYISGKLLTYYSFRP